MYHYCFFPSPQLLCLGFMLINAASQELHNNTHDRLLVVKQQHVNTSSLCSRKLRHSPLTKGARSTPQGDLQLFCDGLRTMETSRWCASIVTEIVKLTMNELSVFPGGAAGAFRALCVM